MIIGAFARICAPVLVSIFHFVNSHCLLSIVQCPILIVHCPILIVHCSILIVHCQICNYQIAHYVHCLLSIVQCWCLNVLWPKFNLLCSISSLLFNNNCILPSVHCPLSIFVYSCQIIPLSFVQCWLFIVKYPITNVQC